MKKTGKTFINPKSKQSSSTRRDEIVELGKNIEANTIEKKQQKSFFDTKKVVITIFCFLISIILMGVTVKFILDINFTTLFSSIQEGLSYNIGILWFSLLFVYLVGMTAGNVVTIWIRLKYYGIKVKAYEYILFAFTIAFLKAVTPSILFSDPYTVFWIKMHGVPTSRATSILFTNGLLWQVVQIFVTLPSFIIIIANCNKLLFLSSGGINGSGLAVFVLMCVGFTIDVFSAVFMYLLNISRRVHYRLSVIFNWFKKKLHMKYHTHEQIREKYKAKAVIKRDFYDFLKSKKPLIWTLLFFILIELCNYVGLAVSMYFVQYQDGFKIGFDFWWVFNCANVSATANRINFLPNGAIGIEWILTTLLTSMSGWQPIKGVVNPERIQKIHEELSANAILVSRCFSCFIPAVIGIFTLVPMTVQQVHSLKKTK